MAIVYEGSQRGTETVDVNGSPENRRFQRFHTLSPHYLLLIIMLVAATLVSLASLVVFLIKIPPASATNATQVGQTETSTTKHSTEPSDDYQSLSSFPIDPSVNITLSPKLKIITRREWLAQPPSEEAKRLIPPVPYVFISETLTEDCTAQASCIFHVRSLQNYHIDSKGWNDIGYNFLIGGDGFIYEGRGWKSQGAHTYGYNSKSVGIAFIGTFNHNKPPERQIIAAKQLLNIGLQNGYLDPNFKLLATRQVGRTNTPGLALYEDLQKWPHWAEQP